VPEGGPSTSSTPTTFDLDAFIRGRLRPDTTQIYAETHDEVERLLFTRALEHTHGNHRNAARLLAISRQTMRVKLRALGLHVAHSVESDDDTPPAN
jgi:two-component system nitrogen regulation response regulator GlnG